MGLNMICQESEVQLLRKGLMLFQHFITNIYFHSDEGVWTTRPKDN